MKNLKILSLILLILNFSNNFSMFKASKILFNQKWQLKLVKKLYKISKRTSDKEKIDLNVYWDKELREPLMDKILSDPNEKVLKFFKEKKFKFKEASNYFNKAMHLGDIEKAKMWLELDCDKNSDEFKRRIFYTSLFYGQFPVAKKIIEDGFYDKDYALKYLISDWSQNNLSKKKEYLEMVELLLKKGANPNQKQENYYYGGDILHHVVRLGFFELVRLLIKYGANINKVDDYGCTPLMWAVNGFKDASLDHFGYIYPSEYVPKLKDGYIELIKFLIKNGAEIDLRIHVFASSARSLLESLDFDGLEDKHIFEIKSILNIKKN